MKIVSISFVPIEYIGVKKKLDSQYEAFQDCSDESDYFRFSGDGYFFNDKLLLKTSIGNKYLRKIQDVFIFIKILRSLPKDVDLIYIRYMRITPWFFFFLRKLKLNCKNLVLEIPSYPYDKEYPNKDILSFSDNFFRTKLDRFVDLITYYGDEFDSIFGVKCLRITNGVSLSDNPLIVKDSIESGRALNFVAVANLAKWHGYDCFLNSIAIYVNKYSQDIHFHIIGSGAELTELVELTSKLNIDKNVTFHGPKSGKELDLLYNKMDVAICSLGLYRIGHDLLSPLKPAEYIARGLPIVLANNDDRFCGSENFIYRAPNNDSLLDVKSIIEWYLNNDKAPSEIRKYAQDNLTWNQQLYKVIKKIV
ncbi:glycosyltransferase [Vibrio cyclitrophicus]|uniref:glycosyltransferase n=1 Tax=Vibrio cyclitrophicus TaxID=47951 RepID=UPI003999683E